MNKPTAPKGRNAFDDLDSFLGGDSALASLAQEVAKTTVNAANGTPLELLLSEVIEDPTQPRKKFDATKMAELAESVRDRGVLQPITVKPKNPDGVHVIVAGARRYRASVAAGKLTIPAYVETEENRSDDFAQMIENIQRDDLKAIEIAGFIQRQVGKGLKEADIAKRLRKPRDYVTRHKAYLEMPEPIQAAYERELLDDYSLMYMTRNLYERYPDVVGPWLGLQETITRAMVRDFAKELEEAGGEDATGADGKAADGAGSQRSSGHEAPDDEGSEEDAERETQAKGPTVTDAFATGGPDGGRAEPPEVQMLAVARCIVMIRVQGRGGRLVLDQISGNDQVLVHFDGDNAPQLIDPGKVKLVSVIGE